MDYKSHGKLLRKSLSDFQDTAVKQVAEGMLHTDRLIGGWLKIFFSKKGRNPY
jgi:hypothetical protein